MSRTFSRDTNGGVVNIVPASLQTKDSTPTFTFSTTDSNVGTFGCAVQPSSPDPPLTYAPCDSSSSHTLAALADGEWDFYVRHIDTLGNFGFGSTRIKIDNLGPTITVNRPTPGFVMESSVLDLDFTAADPAPNTGATLECRFNSEAFVPCDSAFNSRTLIDGSYTLEIRATDGAGNVSTAVVPFSVNTSLDDDFGPNVPAKFNVKKLAGKVVGSKYKLKLQGSFAVPKGADPAVACKGKVRFSIKGQLKGEQAKTFLKTAKLKPVRRTCVYSATFSIPKAYKGKKLVTRTVFKGNTVYGGFSKTATLAKT